MEEDVKSCSQCSEEFSNKTEWKDHMLKTHNVLAFTCDLCPKTFFDQADFIHHFDSEHKSDCNRHICSYCGVTYKWFKFLSKHIKDKHAIEKLMECAECGEEFYNSVAFKKHLRLKHGSGGWKFHKCSKCHRRFTAKELIVLHDRFDHSKDGDQNFKDYAETHLTNLEDDKLLESSKECLKCNLKFSSSIYLMKHFKTTHNKQKYFRCCKCDEAFYNTRAGLSIHLYYEHGVPREHKCNKCRYGHTKTFVNKMRKNKENLSKNRSIEDVEVELPYWAKKFIKQELPINLDLVGATETQVKNLRANIKNLFHVLSTVPPSKLRGNMVVDPYLQFYSARKKLSDDLRRDCRRRDERNIVNGKSTIDNRRPKRKLNLKKDPDVSIEINIDKKEKIEGADVNITEKSKDATQRPKRAKTSDDVSKKHNNSINKDKSKTNNVDKVPLVNKRRKSQVVDEKAEETTPVKDSQRPKRIKNKSPDVANAQLTPTSDKKSKDNVVPKEITSAVENQRPRRNLTNLNKSPVVTEENTLKSDKKNKAKKEIKTSGVITSSNMTRSKNNKDHNLDCTEIAKNCKIAEDSIINSPRPKRRKSTFPDCEVNDDKSPNSVEKSINISSVKGSSLTFDNQRPKRIRTSNNILSQEKSKETETDLNSDFIRQRKSRKSVTFEDQSFDDENSRQNSMRKEEDAKIDQEKDAKIDQAKHAKMDREPCKTIKIFICSECQSEFTLKEELVSHFKSHGKENKMDSFEKSNEDTSTDTIVLESSIPTVIEVAKYKCDLCKTEFKDQLLLLNHLTESHSLEDLDAASNQVYKCIKCGHGFRDKDALDEHIKTHDEYECNLCKKTFGDEKALRLHRMKVHKEKIYKCEKCEDEFLNARDLANHSCGYYENSFDDGGCNSESSTLINKENLENTKIDEEKEDQDNKTRAKGECKRLFKCLKCNSKFTKRDNLLTHIQNAHKVAINKVFKCDKCSAVFKMADKLKQHELLKHSKTEKMLPVIRIKKSKLSTVTLQDSGKIDLLNSLISTTLSKSMHNCKICFSYFPSGELLQRHIQWEHTKNVNLHKCGQCGHVLYSVEDLEIHMHSSHSLDTIVKWKKQIANTYVKQTDVCEGE